MKVIDLFYQGEGIGEIMHAEIESDATVAALKAYLAEKHGFLEDVFVFLEDENKPIGDEILLKEYATPAGVKVHLHRFLKIKVRVTFNGKTVERLFGPGTTISRVKRWAAECEFGMSEEEAGEHVLQIAGKYDRPAPSTHVGALYDGKVRALPFDLVPDERINGSTEGVT